MPANRSSSHEDRLLGMDQPITRRDFLNATAVGAGSALLARRSPLDRNGPARDRPREDWYGYGGVGDYAPSHGNTPAVLEVAHQIRDGRFDRVPGSAADTGEVFDLVIVGGGFTGLGAAHRFNQIKRAGQTCLILENHPIFGGEAKRNEFLVNGHRLIGPQGSNVFIAPADAEAVWGRQPSGINWYHELQIPTEFTYQPWDSARKPLKFGQDNYGFMHWNEDRVTVGYFFDRPRYQVEPRWAIDPWQHGMEGTAFPEQVKRDLIKWQTTGPLPYQGKDYGRWLDTMTYKDYIEKVMGLGAEVSAFADPLLASAAGLGSDVLSAYAAFQILMPGVRDFVAPGTRYPRIQSLPGGNDGFARHFLKAVIPDALAGGNTVADIVTRRVNFQAFDRPGQPVRIRHNATAVRVEHDGLPGASRQVRVTYVRGGTVHQIRARGVVMAAGGWINRRVVRDLPAAHLEAYQTFHHSAVLVANVALTNWRFLYKLGITGARWFDGFGFACNIRQPMIIGDYHPPLDPDQPIVLTFYVPLYYPGRPIADQGNQGRAELLATNYRDYERQIRQQMVRLFGQAGFSPNTDIAGIVLNRWGHALMNPAPGFYFGRDGKPAPPEVIRRAHGRIAFAHAELRGVQGWPGAAAEGRRAAEQVMGAA